MHSAYLDAIRSFEGYVPQAKWDYQQFTNGYGTRALYPGETIDRVEADRRFQAEIATARAVVERHAPDLDEGTKAALTSLTFNAGTAWTKSGLGEAVARGDLDRARDLFTQYTKAGGEVLPGLVNRRAAEVAWFGAGAGATAEAAVPAASTVRAAQDPILSLALARAADLPPIPMDRATAPAVRVDSGSTAPVRWSAAANGLGVTTASETSAPRPTFAPVASAEMVQRAADVVAELEAGGLTDLVRRIALESGRSLRAEDNAEGSRAQRA